MNIKNINKEDRPREKMLKKGLDSLGDNELLAILLDSGTKEYSAIELANIILKKYSLNELMNRSYEDLISFKGIKMAKATKILAAFELAKRSLAIERTGILIDTSYKIFELMKPDIMYLTKEKVFLILIDSKCRLIKKLELASGDVAEVSINYLKIVELFLKYNAYALILVHNHPSGDTNPSIADKEVTNKLIIALANLGISLVDHLIVSKDNYFSFMENHLLDYS